MVFGTIPPLLGCYDCGLEYGGPGWMDTYIELATWIRISPTGSRGGILCITCMALRLEGLGLHDVPMLIGSGPFVRHTDMDLRHQWFEMGRKHEREQAVPA